MTHYTIEQWTLYTKGAEIDRDSMETHLELCEDCMELYMLLIQSLGNELAPLPDVEAFASNLLFSIGKDHSESVVTSIKKQTKRTWFTKPLFQYTVAASITIVLVGSGAFQQLFDSFSDLNHESLTKTTPGISKQLTDKAGEWLDTLPAKNTKKEVKP